MPENAVSGLAMEQVKQAGRPLRPAGPVRRASTDRERRWSHGEAGVLIKTIRSEVRNDRRDLRDLEVRAVVPAGPGSGVSATGKRLSDLIADSLVLRDMAERVDRRAIVPKTKLLMREIGATERRLFISGWDHADRLADCQRIPAAVADRLDQRMRFIESRLGPEFPIGEALDLIAMCMAEALGGWGVLADLAGDDIALGDLAEDARKTLHAQLPRVVETAVAQ